ncbi:MAG: tetratricopeptide repeat protein [Pseudomonadota bacterium]|nr:tetratricopeptide repeat protein [Pseudomonadota bacterium]
MSERRPAEDLIEEANSLSDEGDIDGALKKYFAALEMDITDSRVHYNIGLIYKYRGAWKDSFKYNKRASELAPDDEAAHWNLAIAATALRDWKTARSVWKGLGMPIEPGDSPIEENFGGTPVRLNPDGDAEVVWARRICPVRTRIESIPFSRSGIAFGDVVLNDGAPVGHRLDQNGKERPVFNMIELFEPGPYSTYVVEAIADDEAAVTRLEELCEARELPVEDWATSVTNLCKSCSEGRPHEQHDHDAPTPAWDRERIIAIAASDGNEVEAVLKEWGGEVTDWGVALER